MIAVTDDALLPRHLVSLRPNLRFVCLEENNIGLAVATQADPAEAGSAHVYMQAHRAHVAHFLNNQRLISTCLPHAKDISSTPNWKDTKRPLLGITPVEAISVSAGDPFVRARQRCFRNRLAVFCSVFF